MSPHTGAASCSAHSPWPLLAAFVLTLAGLSAQAQDDAKMKFEIYKGKKDDFRWRLKAGQR